MSLSPNKFNSSPLQALALASLVVMLLFFWQGNIGFNLGDEGFLWYGTQRVIQGEIPLRDFMSYDPGRYYWSATLMTLWGKQDIMALRASAAVFQGLGLFVGLWLIAHSQKKQNFLYLVLCSLILVAWMFPFFKVFDISTSIFLMGILTVLIENPKKTIYFLAGVCLGLFAVFGRNHGIYGLVSTLGTMLWLHFKKKTGTNFLTGFTFWALGIVLGFMPLFLMTVFIPGFAVAFWESIRFLFEVKATNIPLPMPWPWELPFNHLISFQFLNNFLIGIFFIAILAFGVVAICWIFWKKWQRKVLPAALVAAAFTALPYTHYAYSRADLTHLAQGIFPFLIGCLVFFSNLTPKPKWFLALCLGTASFITTAPAHPGWQCRAIQSCVNINVSGDLLRVDSATASNIHFLRQLVIEYASENTTFVITPFWPSAYALFNRKSPMWEIYALFPRSITFQEAEIIAIKKANPRFIFILDVPLDGRDDLRFKNTHAVIYQYILNNYQLSVKDSRGDFHVYIPRGANG
ncbi:MAG: hypothetical protein K0R48_992 [Gammaproteobacteria bacterium]|jgi:hypothetical protein|nr:hypothetical protein [Gammaproteobacteria bacterium]